MASRAMGPEAPPSSGHTPPGLPALDEQTFASFRALILEEAGIALGPHKRALLIARLAPRLRALGIATFAEYYRRVTSRSGSDERVRMIDCICTNETRFFREPFQMDFLSRQVIPGWVHAASSSAPRRIRVWSAACSTGEEPYSVAMELLAALPPCGMSVEIIASDLSTRVLDRAREAIWPLDRTADIPEHHLRAFMRRGRGAQAGRMRAGPELRRAVRFYRVNLNDAACPIVGPFDLILCRNVLIYFGAAARQAVVDRLIERLGPGGYLLLGHAEALSQSSGRLERVMPSVYRREA